MIRIEKIYQSLKSCSSKLSCL